MIGKELQMEVQKYTILDDRVSLLSNILPPTELKQDQSDMHSLLLLSNLVLRRRNKRLNKFNNRLHEQIKNSLSHSSANNKISNEAKLSFNNMSRNLANNEGEDVLNTQTLEIDNKSVLRQIDNETDNLNKSNCLDRKSEFQSEQIDSPSTSKNLEN